MSGGRATGVPIALGTARHRLKTMRRYALWCESEIGRVAGTLEKCKFFLVRMTTETPLAA
jgi:hypothetical protein